MQQQPEQQPEQVYLFSNYICKPMFEDVMLLESIYPLF